MLTTTPMKQLLAIVLESDVDSVTKELLRQGVMQFMDVTAVTGQWRSRIGVVSPRVSPALMAELRQRVETLLRMGGVEASVAVSLDIERLSPIDFDVSQKTLAGISETLTRLHERQRALQQEILKYEDIRRQLDLTDDVAYALSDGTQHSFLDMRTGVVPIPESQAFSEALESVPSIMLSFDNPGGGQSLLLVTMRRAKTRVDAILVQFDWREIELPRHASAPKGDILRDLHDKLGKLKHDQERIGVEVKQTIETHRGRLTDMWANIRLNELYGKIESNFGKTSNTVLFAGWVPASRQQSLSEGITAASRQRCYLEWNDARDVDEQLQASIPVELHNPRFLAPFETLVRNFAIPQYGTIDPTLFVAVAFLVMFGLMFGDAGHGAVLAVIGWLGSALYAGKKASTRNLLKFIGWCGCSAIVAGVLFGAYFGMSLLPPLWFDYHNAVAGHAPPGGFVTDIYGVLAITIYFGIAVIATGLILNWVNLAAKRQWFKLVFDKGGIIGSWIFAAGIYVGAYFVNHSYKDLPPRELLVWLIGVPVLLLALKPPLEYLLHRRGRKFNLFTLVDFFMEWIVEVLEIFSGYLANTLSFMRVAGLGIAHVSLMIAFSVIARMIGGDTINVLSVIVLVLGNGLVIALEGLSAGIQALRLNYYEFFSKYFSGGGKAYMPVSLRENP